MRASIAFATVLYLAACAHVAPPPVAGAAIADRLFCGRSIPDGGTVSDADFETFLRDVVTPRFPDGFTVWRAEGQWRGPDGVLTHEPVMVIEILHASEPAHERAVVEIADEYRRRFRQQAVLRVTVPARIDFID